VGRQPTRGLNKINTFVFVSKGLLLSSVLVLALQQNPSLN
jgi:hypothetical protein